VIGFEVDRCENEKWNKIFYNISDEK